MERGKPGAGGSRDRAGKWREVLLKGGEGAGAGRREDAAEASGAVAGSAGGRSGHRRLAGVRRKESPARGGGGYAAR